MAPDPTIAKVAKLVGLSKTAAARLQREAKRRRMPAAALLKQKLQSSSDSAGSEAGRAPLTARQRAAIASATGSAKGLPRDLSTNPKYMEGFGRD